MNMKKLVAVLVVAVIASGVGLGAWLLQPESAAALPPTSKINLRVTRTDTWAAIRQNQIIKEAVTFQVEVVGNGADCAGQIVVTALGTGGAPPSVLVQLVPFLVGPAVGSDSATAFPLASPTDNDWKVSASCHGAKKKQIDFARFEFFVDVP